METPISIYRCRLNLIEEVNELFALLEYVVFQFYPWFKFSFLLFLDMEMYDNDMIMSLKQKKRKFEPRIKLNHSLTTTNITRQEDSKNQRASQVNRVGRG